MEPFVCNEDATVTENLLFTELKERLLLQLQQDQLVLPSLPEVALQVQSLAADPRSSLRQIADALAADPAMASQIIRLAQTMRYSHPTNPVTTLPIAVTRIGLQGTVNVALALAMRQLFVFYSPQVCLLCRQLQHKAIHISRFALTLCDELTPSHSQQAADFIMLASVLLDIGCLPLLAELDRQVMLNQALPESATLLQWCESLRLPLGRAMLNRWQLDESFSQLLPLTMAPDLPPASRAVILAHRYYGERLLHEPHLAELDSELALHPLTPGAEQSKLLEWSRHLAA